MRSHTDIAATGQARWPTRLAWLALYWLAGVVVMGVAALGLRWLMAAAGLTS
jgi:hypothetical protein